MKTINTFENENEYQEARRKHDLYNAASMQYCKDHKTNGIPQDVYTKFPYNKEVTNELRSKIEVWEFINDIPEKYFLYIDEENKTATTFMGDFLGNVFFGKEYRNNMGDKRQQIDVYSINGKKYYGTYYKSAGDYARITKKKNQN